MEYVHIYNSKPSDVVQQTAFVKGSLPSIYRDCTISNGFELYFYASSINIYIYIYIYIHIIYIDIYIYIKFTEASHHNTLNMTQNRWM